MAMVVMGGICVQSITAIRIIIRLLCWKLVINCLGYFVVVISCYHGDGIDERHVYKVS